MGCLRQRYIGSRLQERMGVVSGQTLLPLLRSLFMPYR